MSSINSVVITGRLSKDPEVRYVGEKKVPVANLSMAHNNTYRGRGGEEKTEVCFVDCVVWNDKALDAKKYLIKGSPIFIKGKLKLDKWVDVATGVTRWKHSIEVDIITYLEVLPKLTKETPPGAEQGSLLDIFD